MNQADLLPLLIQCLDLQHYTINTALACASCLHCVSEDNRNVICDLSSEQHTITSYLTQQTNTQPSHILYNNYLIGILLNSHGGSVTDFTAEELSLLLRVTSSALSLDHRQHAAELADSLQRSAAAVTDEAVETQLNTAVN